MYSAEGFAAYIFCVRTTYLNLNLMRQRLRFSYSYIRMGRKQQAYTYPIISLWDGRLILIDRVAGEIIHLVASVCVSVRLSMCDVCVCVSVCPFTVGAVLFEPFDLWPWFLAWGSTLTLTSLGLYVKVVGQRSRSNSEKCLRSPAWTSGVDRAGRYYCRVQPMVIVNDHYQPVHWNCLFVSNQGRSTCRA